MATALRRKKNQREHKAIHAQDIFGRPKRLQLPEFALIKMIELPVLAESDNFPNAQGDTKNEQSGQLTSNSLLWARMAIKLRL